MNVAVSPRQVLIGLLMALALVAGAVGAVAATHQGSRAGISATTGVGNADASGPSGRGAGH
ncbi:hypothetical protein [Actinoplanes subtropicus]|uniref:hypothetical protein n=1 Tax=Actinoplanes subtropicus TaxID=543632 RepID=UPI0004C31EB4|nr:hypothetical protein [Actinoplanes subtropicus]